MSVCILRCVIGSWSKYFDDIADRLSAKRTEHVAVLDDITSTRVTHAHVSACIKNTVGCMFKANNTFIWRSVSSAYFTDNSGTSGWHNGWRCRRSCLANISNWSSYWYWWRSWRQAPSWCVWLSSCPTAGRKLFARYCRLTTWHWNQRRWQTQLLQGCVYGRHLRAGSWKNFRTTMHALEW